MTGVEEEEFIDEEFDPDLFQDASEEVQNLIWEPTPTEAQLTSLETQLKKEKQRSAEPFWLKPFWFRFLFGASFVLACCSVRRLLCCVVCSQLAAPSRSRR